MSLARFSLRQSTLVNMLFIISMLGGLFVLLGMNVDVFPNVNFAQAKITTTWLGASAKDIEELVTNEIEEEIDDVPGIDRIISHSQNDISLIDVKFREDLSDDEFEVAFNDLRAALDRVADLPEAAEEPTLGKLTVNEIYPLLQVILTTKEGAGPSNPVRRELIERSVARELRKQLQALDGVLKVGDFPIRTRELRVRCHPDRLRQHGLTILDVWRIVQANHRNLPGGPLPDGSAEIVLRSVGEVADAESLLDLEIPIPDSTPARIRDVATVEAGFERRTFLSRYNGRPSMAMGVFKSEGADSIEVRDRVTALVDTFRSQTLPDDLELVTAVDTTKVIKNRIRVLRDSLLFGIVLVFFILWLVVGPRNSALAVVGIPFSFLLAMVILEPMGITVNAISLFSMVLVSGMIVDDAIIVIENIYRHVEMGKPIHAAIIDGVREVTWPVVSATATTMAAFLPMLLMEGVVGEFLSIIPKTVCICLVTSLLECFLILPVHYLDFGPRVKRAANARAERWVEGLRRLYIALLHRVLKRPLLFAFGCMFAFMGSLGLVRTIPIDLFPSDFQAFYVNVVFPPDYSLQQTSEATAKLEQLFVKRLGDGEIDDFTASVGVTWTPDNQVLLRPNVSQLLINFSDAVANDGDPAALIAEIRREVESFSESSGLPFERIEVDSFQDGPPIGKPVAVRVRSNSYEDAWEVAREIEAALAAMDGVGGIAVNLEPGPLEVRVTPRRDRVARLGTDFTEIALTARAANEGLEVGILRPGASDDEIDIRVMLEHPEGRDRLFLVTDADVRLRSGAIARISDIADTDVSRSYLARYHYDADRTVLVTADVDTAITTSDSVNRRLEATFSRIGDEKPGIALHFGGEFEETRRSFESLGKSLMIALILIFMILASQFRSYVLPLVVISTVPLAFIGVVLGLILLGFPFTILTFIAVVGLAGIAVNDSLVLVEFITKRWRGGAPMMEAVVDGCRQRMRAVLLTTVTTVFGLMPMALELTGKSKIWSPFAATMSSGLAIASVLTLLLVPALYVVVARLFPSIGKVRETFDEDGRQDAR